jgi:hypothetical protein
MTRKVLVTGSRNWSDRQVVAEALLAARDSAVVNGSGQMVLVHGAAPGADSIAAELAARWGWRVEAHPALWSELGKAAGPIRNSEMVALGADVCLAFPLPHSRGTLDCMRRAEEAGIPVWEFKPVQKPSGASSADQETDSTLRS